MRIRDRYLARAAVVPFFANPDDGLARLGFEVLDGVTGEATTSSTRGAYNLGNAMVNQIKRQVSKTAGGASLRAEDAFLRDLFTSLRFNDDLTDEQVRFAIEALENPPRDAAGNVIALSPLTKHTCLLYTSPSPRDRTRSRMPSSA